MLVLLPISSVLMGVSYYLSYKISDYPLTVYSPVFMLLSYVPIAFIERDLAKIISNRIVKLIIEFHILITLFMIVAYLIVIVLAKLKILSFL